jgi:hypothetical protein
MATKRQDGALLADTITKLPPEAKDAVIVSGSHGGRYPGMLAAQAGVRAVILHDAGVGKDAAGIGCLADLAGAGIAAATVSHMTCRIGDTDDMMARGRISHANAPARAAGVMPGIDCAMAARLLQTAAIGNGAVAALGEARSTLLVDGSKRRILLLDSASLVQPDDAAQIIVTGSHGGLVGGDPAMALRVDGFAAVFSDAGIGIDQAGIGRLPALDGRRIAAFVVAADSASIGEAASIFQDGIISAVNRTAEALGARPGLSAKAVLLAWARR